MVQNMKGFGLKEKQTARVDLFWQMEMSIKVNGKMIKLMDMEHILIQMELNIVGIG